MNEHSAEPPDPPNTSEPPGDLTAVAAIHAAVEQLAAVTGRQPEGATGVKAGPGGGWSVLVDVVELERIPAATSVLATYRVDVDRQGALVSCERLRRYTRGTTDR